MHHSRHNSSSIRNITNNYSQLITMIVAIWLSYTFLQLAKNLARCCIYYNALTTSTWLAIAIGLASYVAICCEWMHSSLQNQLVSYLATIVMNKKIYKEQLQLHDYPILIVIKCSQNPKFKDQLTIYIQLASWLLQNLAINLVRNTRDKNYCCSYTNYFQCIMSQLQLPRMELAN